MSLSNYLQVFKDEGEVIAVFGDARLVKFLDCEMEIRGGSDEDRAAAREWISMFMHEADPRQS